MLRRGGGALASLLIWLLLPAGPAPARTDDGSPTRTLAQSGTVLAALRAVTKPPPRSWAEPGLTRREGLTERFRAPAAGRLTIQWQIPTIGTVASGRAVFTKAGVHPIHIAFVSGAEIHFTRPIDRTVIVRAKFTVASGLIYEFDRRVVLASFPKLPEMPAAPCAGGESVAYAPGVCVRLTGPQSGLEIDTPYRYQAEVTVDETYERSDHLSWFGIPREPGVERLEPGEAETRLRARVPVLQAFTMQFSCAPASAPGEIVFRVSGMRPARDVEPWAMGARLVFPVTFAPGQRACTPPEEVPLLHRGSAFEAEHVGGSVASRASGAVPG